MKSTTFGLGSDKIEKLLRMGQGTPKKAEKTPGLLDKSVLLAQWLEARLPAEAVPTQVSSYRPSGKTLSLEKLVRLPMGELLGPQASLDVLMALKDYAKSKVKFAEHNDMRDVATVVYFAAIACAWVEHRQMISSVSVAKLCQAMKTLGQKSWICPEIRTWFERAQAQCQRKKESC